MRQPAHIVVPFPAQAQAMAYTLVVRPNCDPGADLAVGFEGPAARDDQPPVRCQECETWWQVETGQADHWTCPGCGRLAIYAIQPGRCPRCDNVTTMLREGHFVRSLCLCHLTPEQRREMDRQERLYQRRAYEEETRRIESDVMRAQAAQGVAEATACWDRKRRKCDVDRRHPAYDYCRVCPRWL